MPSSFAFKLPNIPPEEGALHPLLFGQVSTHPAAELTKPTWPAVSIQAGSATPSSSQSWDTSNTFPGAKHQPKLILHGTQNVEDTCHSPNSLEYCMSFDPHLFTKHELSLKLIVSPLSFRISASHDDGVKLLLPPPRCVQVACSPGGETHLATPGSVVGAAVVVGAAASALGRPDEFPWAPAELLPASAPATGKLVGAGVVGSAVAPCKGTPAPLPLAAVPFPRSRATASSGSPGNATGSRTKSRRPSVGRDRARPGDNIARRGDCNWERRGA
mmetsp:Transcript_27511/g.91285  ORF Transcript_27511/g.91285 Transcript_27511/m.91285 type:complete len:273 (+) Transcript_27511:1754-2572(+)